jgi:UDP-N-acetylmuramoyl-L-alanyl-D-glutamate--2,6-diaminopimelate ligase
MMRIKKLFKDIPDCQIKGSKETAITGISANSKIVAPGNLFIAKKGKTHDGGQFIPEALEAGACAILTDLYDPSLKQVVQIIHPNIAAIEPLLAAEFYQHPSDELFMVGITGTNGKTTTSFIIKSLLDRFCGPCGLIGTIEYIVGSHRYQATRTTPDVLNNHKMLREMCLSCYQSAVMEVTSHALDQGRVEKIDFDVAVFSNLTVDHLDYHQTMENYCAAKRKLFADLGKHRRKKAGKKWAVINQDSPWASRIIDGSSASCLTYGIDQPADLQASHIRLEWNGTRADITFQGKTVECFWPFVGRFNIYNCLAAMGVLLTQGFSLEALGDHMAALDPVRGRLEPVNNDKGLKIYVDFAHSDDALINVLQTLSEFKTGRLIVVFGCGGDRDRTKRPKMAEASERYADFSWVTSDNPRSEDPLAICQEITQGFKRKDSFCVEIDRRSAIQKAIEMAEEKDIILIAGKGHETYQIFAHKTLEFDDVKVAAEICAQLHSSNLC